MKSTIRIFRGAFGWLIGLMVMAVSGQALSQGAWTTKAPMPLRVADIRDATVINNMCYVVSSDGPITAPYNKLQVYNPATDTWTIKTPPSHPRYSPSTAALNGLLYVVGGYDGGRHVGTVEAYDPATETWVTKTPMNQVRYTMALVAVNGKLYAIGGWDDYSGRLATVEVYDPSTDSWTYKAPMPTARDGLAAGVVNNVIYAVGGQPALAKVEAYDPVTNTWTTKSSMSTGRIAPAVAMLDGLLYVVGGGNYTGLLNAVEAYDPVSNTWSTKTPMPTARYLLGAAVVDGVLYAMGGNAATGLTTVNEAFTPVSTFTISASAGANGSISPSGDIGVNSSSDQLFTITPNTSFHIAEVLVDGSSVGAVSSYMFTNVTANHTISASFAINVLTVVIDIKPGSFPNAINPNSKGSIPVAILSTSSFDATTVNPLSVKFGPNGATEIHNMGHIENVNGDGDLDLVLHFATQATGIRQGDVAVSLTGRTISGQDIRGSDAIVTVGGNSKLADGTEKILISQGYPNPFNPATQIRYELPSDGFVTLKIYNSLGQEVAILVNGFQKAGTHAAFFQARDLASGVYFYCLQTDQFIETNKMVLLK